MLNTVLCLTSKPAKANPSFTPASRTRNDDFVAVHIKQTLSIHGTVRGIALVFRCLLLLPFFVDRRQLTLYTSRALKSSTVSPSPRPCFHNTDTDSVETLRVTSSRSTITLRAHSSMPFKRNMAATAHCLSGLGKSALDRLYSTYLDGSDASISGNVEY